MGERVLNPKDNPSGRYLLRATEKLNRQGKPYEASILEWAPSGSRVKLRYPRTKHEQWVEVDDHGPFVVERLPD